MRLFAYLSCFVFLYNSIFTAPRVWAAADTKEIVCVQDVNNSGYAGEQGETASCISDTAKVGYYCPIGAVQCDSNTKVTVAPSVDVCPEGYTLATDGESCTRDKLLTQAPTYSCPSGYTYNGSTGVCEKNYINKTAPVLECPTGYNLDASKETCTKQDYTYQPPTYSCPSGYSYNATNNLCENTSLTQTQPTYTCPAGQTERDGKCYQQTTNDQCDVDGSSPSECRYNKNTDYALTNFVSGKQRWTRYYWDNVLLGSASGTAYKKVIGDYLYYATKKQVDEKQDSTTTWRYSTICRCGAVNETLMGTATPQCSQGTYNPTSKMCESGSNGTASPNVVCPSGYSYSIAQASCEKVVTSTVPVAYECANGIYSTVSKMCEEEVTDNVTPARNCPDEYSYNTKSGMCEKTEIVTAPVAHNCDDGFIYNPTTRQCEKSENYNTCPLSNGGACVVSGINNKAYCSPNPCFDRSEEVSVDDIDGTMLVDNGEKDSSGACTDQVLIFSGRASECLPSGISNAYQNCCKNDGKVENDSVGSYSEISTAISAIKNIYSVASAAAGAYASAMQSGATSAQAANAATSAAQSQIQALMNPATIAWAIAIYLIMSYLMQACDTMSIETSMHNDSGFCHEVGTYCKKKWLGSCVQTSRAFCCFNSKMARIIHEQGRPQLKSFNGWGEAKDPDCRGFTPEEFQALDFSKIDMSEYYDDLVHQTQDAITNSITNSMEQYFDDTQ